MSINGLIQINGQNPVSAPKITYSREKLLEIRSIMEINKKEDQRIKEIAQRIAPKIPSFNGVKDGNGNN